MGQMCQKAVCGLTYIVIFVMELFVLKCAKKIKIRKTR